MITNPSRELLINYKKVTHDESFGINRTISPSVIGYNLFDFGKDLFTDRKRLIEIYWHVGWPESLAHQIIGFVPPAWMMKKASDFLWKDE